MLKEEIEFVEGPWDGRVEVVPTDLMVWSTGYLPDWYAVYNRDYRITATARNAFRFSHYQANDHTPRYS